MRKDGKEDCPCWAKPMDSRCGNWEGNASACVCVDMGLEGLLPP